MTLIYFDIDGTLTRKPNGQWGEPIQDRIAAVIDAIDRGHEVVVWSGRGTKYAKAFAEKYGILGALCIGKPDIAVDDDPDIRPRTLMRIVSPEEWFEK